MTNLASQKIEELNQQIESLKKKKEQISNKHLEQIAKVITKCTSNQWSLEMIAGIMLEAQERLNTNPQLCEVWHCAGEKFLTSFKRTTSSKGQAFSSKAAEDRPSYQKAVAPTRENSAQVRVD